MSYMRTCSQPERVTHQQIADAVGISRVVVTKVLHGAHGTRVSAETRDQIEQAARDLGYRPRNQTSHTIAYVSPLREMQGEAQGIFICYLEQALRARGYRLALIGLDGDNLHDLREVLTPKTVDGVFFTYWHGGAIVHVIPPEVPFVLTSDEDNIPPEINLVTMDTVGTLERVAEYLLAKGHQRLCLLTARSSADFYQHMEQGVRRTLYKAGLAQENLRTVAAIGSHVPGTMARQLVAALREADAPTAVIAADLWQALPAVYALRDGGYRIPDDVSFVSVFDSNYFQELHPPCTVTTALSQELAEQAAEVLLEKLEHPHSAAVQMRLPGEIVERGSVGPPPDQKRR